MSSKFMKLRFTKVIHHFRLQSPSRYTRSTRRCDNSCRI